MEDEIFSSDSESSENEGGGTLEFAEGIIFQEIVHVALSVRQDPLDIPGHSSTWHGFDQEHVDQVIPDSLYLLLRLVLKGIDKLYDETDEEKKTALNKLCVVLSRILCMECLTKGS